MIDPATVHFSVPIVATRLTPGLALVTDVHRHRQALVSPTALSILVKYQTPAPLSAAVLQHGPGDGPNRNVAGLNVIADGVTLLNEGWLVPESAWLANLSSAPPASPAPARSQPRISIAVLTNDRTELLARCLDSVYANCDTGHDIAVVTVDDCRVHENARHVASAKRALARRSTEARYAGVTEKSRAVTTLAKITQIDEEVLRFAFLGDRSAGPTTGANMNCAICDAAGDHLVFCDDDVVWDVGAPSWAGNGVQVGAAQSDPTEIAFYESCSEAMSAVRASHHTVVGLHERYLGEPIRKVVDQAAGAVHIGRISRSLYGDVVGQAGSIAVSVLGIVGDCGLWSPRNYLHVTGPSRERLARTAAYRQIRTSRQVLRAARETTLSDSGWLMAGGMALDTDRLVPPFMPNLRNSDGVFGQMLRIVDSSAYTCCLPFVVAHRPEGRAVFSDDAIWADAPKIRFSEHLTKTFEQCPLTFGQGSPAERLCALGAWLNRIGTLPASSLDAYLRDSFERIARARVLNALRQLDEEPGAPAAWHDDLKRQVSALTDALERRWTHLPADIETATNEPHARIAESTRLMMNFAQLVSAWPSILSVCHARRVEFGGTISMAA